MARGDRPNFQWNIQPEGEPASILETMPSSKGAIHHLLEIVSALRQLRRSYLSAEQRARLGESLRQHYIAFQRVAAATKDATLHQKLTEYLALVGSIGVTSTTGEEPYTLLEAIATSSTVPWAHHLYSATHGIRERDVHGEYIAFQVTEQPILKERELRRELLHILEDLSP